MQHIHTDPILLNPGPVTLSSRVRSAMSAPDMCHREPEFAALMRNVRSKLLCIYGLGEDQFGVAILSGSGTAAVESALAGAIGQGDSLLIVSNGVYGERMATMAQAYGIPNRHVAFDWGAEPEPQRIGREMDESRASVLALVHHETTTGALTDIDLLAQMAKDRGMRVVIDAVSSFGGERMDFSLLDFVAATANKCIHGIPGIAFVIVRRCALPATDRRVRRSFYLDLQTHLDASDACVPAFTPAIPSLYVLNTALDELLENGVEHRMALYRHRAGFIRKALTDAGFELLLAASRSSAVLTAAKLPADRTYEQLHDHLKRDGFVVYAGQGDLSDWIFRIANMGAIKESDLERLSRSLKSSMTHGRPTA